MEDGKERAWLKAIAKNAAFRYYNKERRAICISLDSDESPLLNLLVSGEKSPEEQTLHNELVQKILQLVSALPDQQRLAVTYRYANNFSIAETARIMGLPEGTVKSNASYGLQALRKQLGVEIKKGAKKMKNCTNMYGILFEYAKGFLTEEERAEVKAHIADCKDCAKVVSALTALWPYLQKEFNESGYVNYFNVVFDLGNKGVGYAGARAELPKDTVEQINSILEESGGKVPETMDFMNIGQDSDKLPPSTIYINDGMKTEYKYVTDERQGKMNCVFTVIPKVYEEQWVYIAGSTEGVFVQSKDAPNLYEFSHRNYLGSAAKCGSFTYIDEGVTNIRIKKGSGVLKLDGHTFAYSQRFTTEDEGMYLTFSFNR